MEINDKYIREKSIIFQNALESARRLMFNGEALSPGPQDAEKELKRDLTLEESFLWRIVFTQGQMQFGKAHNSITA